MRNDYSAPSIQVLGTLKELTAGGPNDNGCGGIGNLKKLNTGDGFGNAQTGCAVS